MSIMVKLVPILAIAASVCPYLGTTAFLSIQRHAHRDSTISLNAGGFDGPESRRQFITITSLLTQSLLMPTQNVLADYGEDLTTQMFNPDGSLKKEVEKAKEKTIEIMWAPGDSLSLNVDGSNSGDTQAGSGLRLTYKLPEKWEKQGGVYIDRSKEDAKACERVLVYRAAGKVEPDRLQKAATKGVATSLQVTDDLQILRQGDLISGRTRRSDENKYYEFDMAVAPLTCGSSKENLGLGFCPYETIFLLSSVLVDENLFVLAVECDKKEWQKASADLKRVRSSFSVEST